MTMRTVPLLLAVLASACGASLADQGRHLFEGEVALTARIAGHDEALPAQASRCSNCHDFAATAAPPAPPATPPRLGGAKVVLAAPSLAASKPRRGGPPSRFDEASLCRLLRTGIDPASVVIPQSMPRYEVDAAQCKALWAYLGAGAS